MGTIMPQPVRPYVFNQRQSCITVHGLEVWIDRGLSMSTHVTKVVSGCFAALRQLYAYSIRRSVSQESLIGLVVSLVLTRLDHCNAVFVGLLAYQLDRLQSAINPANFSV